MYDCCMCYWHAAINAYLLPRDMWCNREGKYVFVRSLEQEVAEVVEYGKGHEQEQQCHADCLGALHKLVAWFATCNDFDEEEKYMSTIKRWYWQYVHKGEHERNECRKFPKRHQSHVVGNRLPIAPNEPTLFAPSAVNRYLRSST